MTDSGRQAFLKNFKLFINILLISSLAIFNGCDEDAVQEAIEQASQVEENQAPVEDGEGVAPIVEEEEQQEPDFFQDFESFASNRNWYLSDFGINGDSERTEYVTDSEIKFKLYWTKRARNLMADRMNIERSVMTHDYANTVCEPQIEVGKERVYTSSSSDNMIAELDSDLNHCGISGNEPATLSLKSFIPTKIGYNYKLEVRYRMRSYGAQAANSYKDLVVRFGPELEKFDPVFDDFQTVSINMLSTQKFSKLVLRDNGLPDSYGVLVDDIKVYELEKAENYDSCAEIFRLNSKGFKKCLKEEINTEELCSFDDPANVHIKYKEGQGVVESRKNTDNAVLDEPSTNGRLNFLSLGLKGRVAMACEVGGYPALFSIHNKVLSLREISWGNATPASYPELAKVRVKLEGCDEEELNRVNTIGTVQTSEHFSYSFDQNEDGLSYAGCKMSKLIIKDITPTGPSADGFDLNSVKFTDIPVQ